MGPFARTCRWAVAGAVAAAGTAAAQSPLPPAPPAAAFTRPADGPQSAFGTPGSPDRPADKPRDPSDRPLDPKKPLPGPPSYDLLQGEYKTYPPLGFAGPSAVVPRSGSNEEYVTVEDRWRIGFPEWDRYPDIGHPMVNDFPYRLGRWFDPYNQNVLKGDYPVYGQHTFFTLTATNTTTFELRKIPTATTPFESTLRPDTVDFFGRDGQFLFSNLFLLSLDLKHGDASFKPDDWRVHVTPALNINTLSVQELGVVSPDIRRGTIRNRSRFMPLQEAFGEVKLFDLSPEYDFMSIRAGNQPFNSDFRGFIFSDINKGVRLFGNLNGNRDQFNLVFFRQNEKDSNSGLNTFEDRNQNIIIANWYRQDFGFPGYTIQGSVHYNNDGPDLLLDRNGFLVRPDPAGVFQPHRVESAYFGVTGDGHIDRFNISHAAYWAVGRDSRNPIAGRPQAINAQMAACELSYDRDWARFRVSGFWASGDGEVNNGTATGFDGIIDNTNFGGEGSFFNRQNVPLFGNQLVQRNSLYTSLRSSKIQGQSNFVNPGLWLVNFGLDTDITPRLRFVNNVNFMWFDKTDSLQVFVFQDRIDRDIGTDLSTLIEYRPILNNNLIIMSGASVLVPGGGFRQLYNRLDRHTNALASAFVEVILQY
jgi:hypothetical protein